MRLEYDPITDFIICWNGRHIVYALSYWEYVREFGTRPDDYPFGQSVPR